MVEVLKKGELKKYTIKCCYCDSILRFTSLDEKENFTIDSEFEVNSSDWYVECPNCKTKVPTRTNIRVIHTVQAQADLHIM